MLNRFLKKSILSKLFFMNLLILVCIVVSQLFFQAIYFEKYYINQKKQLLSNSLNDFKDFIIDENSSENIMDYIQNIKKQDNISLSFRNEDLYGGIGLEAYMGDKQIIMKNNMSGQSYKVIIGDKFKEARVNKNDFIQVYGSMDSYGYIFADRLFINGIEIESYYQIVPTENITSTQIPAIEIEPAVPTMPIGELIYMEGNAEKLVLKDDVYRAFANEDLFLDYSVKNEIISKDKYSNK